MIILLSMHETDQLQDLLMLDLSVAGIRFVQLKEENL